MKKTIPSLAILALPILAIGCLEKDPEEIHHHHYVQADAGDETAIIDSGADQEADVPSLEEAVDFLKMPNLAISEMEVIGYEINEEINEEGNVNTDIEVKVVNNGYKQAEDAVVRLHFPGGQMDSHPQDIREGEIKTYGFREDARLSSIMDFTAEADPSSQILEVHEDDNTRCVDLYSTPCAQAGFPWLPDLISDTFLNARIENGELRIDYWVTVKNIGARPVYRSTKVEVEVDVEIEHRCRDRPEDDIEEEVLSEYDVLPLREQEEVDYQNSISYPLPVSNEDCVVDYIEVDIRSDADSSSIIPENDEDNNRSRVQFEFEGE